MWIEMLGALGLCLGSESCSPHVWRSARAPRALPERGSRSSRTGVPPGQRVINTTLPRIE